MITLECYPSPAGSFWNPMTVQGKVHSKNKCCVRRNFVQKADVWFFIYFLCSMTGTLFSIPRGKNYFKIHNLCMQSRTNDALSSSSTLNKGRTSLFLSFNKLSEKSSEHFSKHTSYSLHRNVLAAKFSCQNQSKIFTHGLFRRLYVQDWIQ